MHNAQFTIIRVLGEQPVRRLQVGAAPVSGAVWRRCVIGWVATRDVSRSYGLRVYHAKGMALREDSCIYIIESYVFRNAACPQVAFFQISIYGRQRPKMGPGRAPVRRTALKNNAPYPARPEPGRAPKKC